MGCGVLNHAALQRDAVIAVAGDVIEQAFGAQREEVPAERVVELLAELSANAFQRRGTGIAARYGRVLVIASKAQGWTLHQIGQLFNRAPHRCKEFCLVRMAFDRRRFRSAVAQPFQ